MAEYSYGADEVQAVEQTFEITGGGGFWDEAVWDQFYWSAPVQGTAVAPIDGQGINISITVVSEATYEDPHTLSAMTIHWTKRRMVR